MTSAVPSQPTSVVDPSGRAVTAPEARPSRPRQPRLGYLDALRGLAVLMVLFNHFGEAAIPWLGDFCNETFALGPAAVMVFFACSGFIIPVSLERAGDLRAFWISRFMRLYPLYWLSLALAAVLAAFGRYAYLGPQGPTPGTTWLANLTAMQLFIGQPNIIIVYWTLAWEMLFYILLSVLFVVGLHRRSVLLSVAANVLVLGAAVAAAVTGHVDDLPIGLMALVFMFLGTVWYRWTVGEVTGRVLSAVVAGAAVTVTVFAVLVLHVGGTVDPDQNGEHRWPMLAGWLAGLAIFCLVVYWGSRGGRVPDLLRRLGIISYSIYLLQAIVIAVVPKSDSVPVGVTVSIWFVGILALSAATYRWIEKPALNLGHRWARRWRRPPPAQVAKQ